MKVLNFAEFFYSFSWIKWMQSFTDILLLCNCALHCAFLQWVSFELIRQLFHVLSDFSNLQYRDVFFKPFKNIITDSPDSYLVATNCVLLENNDIFLGRIIFCIIWIISTKVKSSSFNGWNIVETVIIGSHPVVNKRSITSYSLCLFW